MSRIVRGSLVLALHQTPARLATAPMGTSTPALRRILLALREQGYRFVGLDEMGPSGPPAGTVALTADDGYKSQIDHLSPLLRELALPWTVFVLAGRLGLRNVWDLPWMARREDHLTSDEVRRLAQEGVTIGSHGMTHSKMTTLSNASLEDELVRSRELLRRLSGQKVDGIAYPWGATDARVAAAARRAGYRLMFGATAGGSRPPDGRPFIPRVTLYATDQFFPLFAATTMDAPRPLRLLRGGLESLGWMVVDAAIATQARRRA